MSNNSIKHYLLCNKNFLFILTSFIQTRYVLVVPDAVRLNHAERFKGLDIYNLESTYKASIIAFPVDEGYHCSELKVELRLTNL